MMTNSQLSTTEPKKQTNKQSKQLRTGTELQKPRSHGGLSTGRDGHNGGKGIGNEKHEW